MAAEERDQLCRVRADREPQGERGGSEGGSEVGSSRVRDGTPRGATLQLIVGGDPAQKG